MKGMSEVVSIILTITITIAMVSYFFINLSKIDEKTKEFDINISDTVLNQMGVGFRIESATTTQVYLRNEGSVTMPRSSIALYIDNSLVDFSSANAIEPGTIGILYISRIDAGYHKFKVTAIGGTSSIAYLSVS
jgi:hypothetical protein